MRSQAALFSHLVAWRGPAARVTTSHYESRGNRPAWIKQVNLDGRRKINVSPRLRTGALTLICRGPRAMKNYVWKMLLSTLVCMGAAGTAQAALFCGWGGYD